MADLQLAISEAVVRKLFVTARDNFAFSIPTAWTSDLSQSPTPPASS
jgi:hypothetical protein